MYSCDDFMRSSEHFWFHIIAFVDSHIVSRCHHIDYNCIIYVSNKENVHKSKTGAVIDDDDHENSSVLFCFRNEIILLNFFIII